jgi:hypothetical protein
MEQAPSIPEVSEEIRTQEDSLVEKVEVKSAPDKAPAGVQKKVLRGGLFKTVATAGLIGLSGAVATDNAEAQNWSNAPTMYQGGGQQQGQNIQVNSAKGLGNVAAMIIGNNVLSQAGVPARVGMNNGQWNATINLSQLERQQQMSVEIMQDAQETMNAMGLAYEAKPFYIANMRNPNQKINVGGSTIHVRVTKAGESNIFVEAVFVENGRKILQKILAGIDQNGNLITAELARQAL